MKKKNAALTGQCCYCKKPYQLITGKGFGCASCWDALWRRYAAEDAIRFYVSPLAGIND